jgi:hypothetical protein
MRKWIVGCLLALVILPCGALDVEIKLVDIEFKMTSEHNFLTTLDVKWEVQSSTMGGFYLQVPEGVENIIGEQSYAILNARTRVKTEVTKVGPSRYDIDLENGIRFSGSAIFHLEYYYDPTTLEDGSQVLSIVGWDQLVESQRITIITDTAIEENGALDLLADKYSIQTTWDARVEPVKIYLPNGTLLGYRIEEDNVPDHTSRGIAFKNNVKPATEKTVAFAFR